MFKKLVLSGSFLLLVPPALAGFDRWSVEFEDDPFSGGKKVMIDYSSSIRSGVFIECDTSGTGIEVRSVAGWEIDAGLVGEAAATSIAVDGTLVVEEVESLIGACGQSIACTSAQLDKESSKKFADAMVIAKKQVAIKDGISNKPFLLKASGSTKTGEALLKCLDSQK